jgi:hypothetical protein
VESKITLMRAADCSEFALGISKYSKFPGAASRARHVAGWLQVRGDNGSLMRKRIVDQHPAATSLCAFGRLGSTIQGVIRLIHLQFRRKFIFSFRGSLTFVYFSRPVEHLKMMEDDFSQKTYR